MAHKKKRGIKFVVCFWLVLIFLNGISSDSTAKCPIRMGSIYSSDNFLVIARKGSKFPENTIPAFQKALDGANSLIADLSLTRDRKVVLWHGEDKDTHINISTFQDLMEWATTQVKLKVLLLKLRVPANESHLAPVLLEEIRKTMGAIHPAPRFQLILLTPHKEVLNRVRNKFDEFLFSYDQELEPVEITNYHRFTTVPTAMDFKNSFASIGFLAPPSIHEPFTQDPWLVYKYILTLDFRIRDNYKKNTSNYIKIISWSLNDEKKIRCLINLGVDGIVTDNPKMLRRIALDMGKNID